MSYDQLLASDVSDLLDAYKHVFSAYEQLLDQNEKLKPKPRKNIWGKI